MKRWALLTALLYALALLLLTVPVVFVTLGKTGTFTLKESAALYGQQGYWLWLAILVAGQILLLLVPVDVSQKRLPSRRKLQVPVIVSAFFLGNLCFAGIFSVVCAILGDRAFDAFDLARLFSPGNPPEPTATNCVLTMVLTLVVFWLAWAVLFRRATRADAPGALADRLTRWLLRGSILELIIAVPCHVVVRRRDDCCAPAGTFWGIATGLSVMLLCFGPGVYYLFADRCRRLKPGAVEK